MRTRAEAIVNRVQDRARFRNVTAEERRAVYPCDACAQPPYEEWLRAVDIDYAGDHQTIIAAIATTTYPRCAPTVGP